MSSLVKSLGHLMQKKRECKSRLHKNIAKRDHSIEGIGICQFFNLSLEKIFSNIKIESIHIS